MIIGHWTADCGYTYLAKGNNKVYFLRSLQGGSFLCVYKSDGKTLLGEYPTAGSHSCHITILERQAVISNYSCGTLSLISLNDEGFPYGDPFLIRFEGSGPDRERQGGPHIHSSCLSPDGRSLVVSDLGSDKIYLFDVRGGCVDDASRQDFIAPSGSGPRHFAFDPNGTHLYVTTELSDEVLVFSYPDLSLLQRVEVNPRHPRGGAHIAIRPDGRFLYASSRGCGEGIAVFAVGGDGLLTKVGYTATGSNPRHFAITEDGLHLVVACRDSNSVETFSISLETGLLSAIAEISGEEKPVFILL